MTATPAGWSAQYVLIIHEVVDYAKWKAIFDGAAIMRRDAGEIEYRLLTYDTDARRVVHFSRWSSLDAARVFFESPELVEIRRVAGVRAPEFLYLNEVEAGHL
ncbi:MAG: antibiotic biosynthesis monooxygenase [Alphaproteobacteria bacterium]